MQRSRLLLAALGVAPPLAGCQPGDFQDLARQAPVVAVDSTSPFPSETFGAVLGSYQVAFPDGTGATFPVSRIAVGTGMLQLSATQVDGIVASYSGWNGGSLDLGRKVFARCSGTTSSCPPDTSVSLAGLPSIGGELGCVLAGAPGAFAGSTGSYVTAACETSRSVFVVASAEPPDGLGTSVAAFPSATPYGVAIAGAPSRGTSGAIVVLPDDLVPDPAAPEITQESLGLQAALAGFGSALAATALPDAQTLTTLTDPILVAAATGSATGSTRVVVFALGTRDVGGASTLGTEALGCLDFAASGGEGTVLALGDVVGDALPDLVIGARADAPGRSSQVRVLELGGLGATGLRSGCAAADASDDPASTLVPCTDSAGGSTLTCANGGFGSSLAIGDANGDGKGDLLVGAPYTAVEGRGNAGAAYLLPGGTTLGDPVVLVTSAPHANDTLGISVTFLPSQLGPGQTPRAEPVAGAPGHGAVFVFLCSGLEGDSPTSDAPRCIVQN